MATDPSITEWISAVSTATLGALGIVITLWQWFRRGFNPQLTARIDGPRQAIELRIVNKGRAAGIIDQVDVVLPSNEIVDDAKFEGFGNNAFRPIALPGMAAMRIVIQAPESGPFALDAWLLVGIGTTKPKKVIPAVTAPGVGIFGLRSVLPPGTPASPGES